MAERRRREAITCRSVLMAFRSDRTTRMARGDLVWRSGFLRVRLRDDRDRRA